MADGDLASADSACAAWRDDPAAREAWATYHLIGDSLRSDDLAGGATAPEVFLHGVRRRLAAEPVVLAPAPRRRLAAHWGAPMAVAAGLAAVAVTLLVLRQADNGMSHQPVLAVAPAGAPVSAAASSGIALASDEPRWQSPHRRLIRDEQLDAYLRAHRGAPEAMPGAASGRFETVVLER